MTAMGNIKCNFMTFYLSWLILLLSYYHTSITSFHNFIRYCIAKSWWRGIRLIEFTWNIHEQSNRWKWVDFYFKQWIRRKRCWKCHSSFSWCCFDRKFEAPNVTLSFGNQGTLSKRCHFCSLRKLNLPLGFYNYNLQIINFFIRLEVT